MFRRLPTLGLLVALMAGSAFAQQGEPTRVPAVDELEQLHAKELSFRPDGVPIISIGLTSGQRRIRVTSDDALIFRLGRQGDQEVTVAAGDEWEVRLKNPHRGKTRTWVIAERFVGTDPVRVEASRARWTRYGHRVKVFMSGTLVDLEGQRIDTRIATVAIAPEANRRRARRRANQIKEHSRILGRLKEEYLERPGGTFVLTNLRSGETLTTHDLVSVRGAGADGLVEIMGVKWARGHTSRRYPGEVSFLVGRGGKLEVVNQVDAETVVKGVVPTELFPEAPIEALKAQAVLARGQLLSKLGHRHPSKPYHLCARAHCQGYAGVERTSDLSDSAVKSTRGQMVFDRFGLTDTVYHSSCGGRTEAYHEVWGGPPNRALAGVSDGSGVGRLLSTASVNQHLKSRSQSWCAMSEKGRKSFRWTARRNAESVSRRVNEQSPIGPVHAIHVLRRGRSGRVIDVEYEGTFGRYKAKGWALNRRLLKGLKSGLWTVSRRGGKPRGEPSEWVFRGGGHGHGVGMCQYGALSMAERGRSYTQILTHYFPHTRIETLW